MNKIPLVFFAVVIATSAAIGVDIELSSNFIPLPNADGTFSDNSSEKFPVQHIYRIISEEEYIAYTSAPSPEKAIYESYLAGNLGIEELFNETVSIGYSKFFLSEIDEERGTSFAEYFGYEENAYFAAVYLYTNSVTGAEYYIARPLQLLTLSEDEYAAFYVSFIHNIAGAAGRWQVVSAEPPEIVCQAIDVAGGIVSATYGINDIDSLDELVIDGETSVIVAADLARTTQTNLAASVTATNSVDSTFTFSFNPAEQNWTNSTLFIFGVELPR